MIFIAIGAIIRIRQNHAKTTYVKADQIILAARDQAKEEHENAILETQAKTDRMIEKAKADIEKEQKQAQQEVQGEIAKLALIAARKIIETGEAHDAEGSK